MSDDVLDLADFKERVQDDIELLLELLDIYEEDYKKKRVALEEAVRGRNPDEVRNIAHSLKGASGNISAGQLRESFYKLEEMGKTKNLEGAQAALSQVDQEYEALARRFVSLREELK
jgi:HPt (histidine-containing phosphotransfer) domain-containing protein